MKSTLEQNIKHTQKLIITTEMKQAIEVLQCTAMELKDLVDKNLLENPILELENDDHGTVEDTKSQEKEHKEDERESVDWEAYFQHAQASEIQTGPKAPSDIDDTFTFEKFFSFATTLKDYLLLQLHMVSKELTENELLMAEEIIACIDHNGYVTLDENVFCKQQKIEHEDFEKILRVIQTFDPIGVGARHPIECLWLQMVELGLDTPDYKILLTEYLEMVANNQWHKIVKETGISLEEIDGFKQLLSELEPKPGRLFYHPEETQYVVPDAGISIVDGELAVTVNEGSVPHLRINTFYSELLKKEKSDDETKDYIRKKLDGALFLIRNIEERKKTITRVVQAIADYQMDFFTRGTDGLRPLQLKTVAEMIDVHESTVSRAIRGKYVQTPRGLYPLKYFFKSGYVSGGQEVSSETIKNKIRRLIEAEDKKSPLSDQKIAELLKKEDADVARRTVAKYREAMGILSSSKRKVMF